MNEIKELHIRQIDDFHVHLRQGEMLANVLPHTALYCGRALAMPNTIPAIITAVDLKNYRSTIQSLLGRTSTFVPLMTFKLMADTTPQMVRELKKAGATAGKLYPEGVTTNSEDGIRDIEALYPVFAAMQEESLVLCLHGEVPGVFCLDRETAFLTHLSKLATDFPRLRIVLEHATTEDAVNRVLSLPDSVAATITAHHLYLTLDDVVGDKLMPHHFCKPIAKRPGDRQALRRAATSGSPKFFLGSDSAAHPVDAKESACGAAGVYTAPILLPLLAEVFQEMGALERLEGFTSQYGAQFYGLPLNERYITLAGESWTVPEQYDNVVPFMAGKTLSWKVIGTTGDADPKSCATTAGKRSN